MERVEVVFTLLVTFIGHTFSREKLESGVVVTIFPDDPWGSDHHHVYMLDGDPADIYHRYTNNTDAVQSWYRFGYNSFKESKLVSCGVNYAKNKLYLLEGNTGRVKLISNWSWKNDFRRISSTTAYSGISLSLYVKIAVDWVSDNVYIADPVYRWIVLQSGNARPRKESLHRVLIEEHLSKPTAIAVSPTHGFLFWCDVGRVVKIERSDLTGKDRVAIIWTGLVHPVAITVDVEDSMIYWTDIEAYTVARSDFNGRNRLIVLRSWKEEFTDIIVLGDIITIAVYTTGYPRFINKHTGKVLLEELQVDSIKGTIWGLCQYNQALQPQPETNFCLGKSCSNMCINGLNEATCACRDGYELNEDNTSCSESLGEYNRAIVVAGNKSICLKDIRNVVSEVYTDRTKCIVNETDTHTGITYFDLDVVNRKIYFSTNRSIYSTPIDSQAPPQQIASTIDTITGLGFDWRSMNLYWSTGLGPGTIEVFDLASDYSIETIVEANLTRPRELIVIPLENTMIWISGTRATSKIEKANMDGSGRESIREYPHITDPASITFDQESQTLFWTERGDIRRCNLDGSNWDILKTDSWTNKHLVILYRNHLIYTEDLYRGTRIRSDDITAPRLHDSEFTVPEVGKVVTCIRILDSRLQPSDKGPCEDANGGCDHMCLPVGESSTCRCEHGFTLDGNNKTCSSSYVTDNFLLVTDLTHGRLYQVDEATGTVHGFHTDVDSTPSGVVYNFKTQQVFWTDSEGLIHRINIDGSGYKVLKAFGSSYPSLPKRLAIDYSTGNLYYTLERSQGLPYKPHGIGVVSPAGVNRILVEDVIDPTDIVLDPEDGFVFWIDVGTIPSVQSVVQRAHCDGSSITNIIRAGDNLEKPSGLAIDPEINTLYVADSRLDTIQQCTYEGRCDVIHTSEGASLADIALAGAYIYYTALYRPYVTKINRFSPEDPTTLARDSEFGRLDSIAVYRSRDTSLSVSSSCANNNGGCSTFCFPAPDGHVCGCEDGWELYYNDKYTCQKDGDRIGGASFGDLHTDIATVYTTATLSKPATTTTPTPPRMTTPIVHPATITMPRTHHQRKSTKASTTTTAMTTSTLAHMITGTSSTHRPTHQPYSTTSRTQQLTSTASSTQRPTSTASSTSQQQSSADLQIAVLVGAAVVAAVLIMAAAVVVAWLVKRRRSTTRADDYGHVELSLRPEKG